MEYFDEDNILNKMVEIIDKIEILPKECPEIVKSQTFQYITEEIQKLCKIFHAQAEALNNNAIFPSASVKDNN
jgi:hypothetical protein